MKKTLYILLILPLVLGGCIRIENDPLVTVTPTVDFQGHIRNDEVYVTTTVYANPTFVDAGNIPVKLYYEGSVAFYDEASGDLLAYEEISGEGLTNITVTSSVAESIDNMIVIVRGTVSAYADKDSDGDSSNDLFIHSADFYQEEQVSNIVILEDYPVVIMDPTVEFQMYIRNNELYTTSTISANPDYLLTGTNSIVFKHEGVLQVYDVTSGALLKSASLAGTGYTNAVTILTDTSSFSGFIIIASGTITCNEDVENDGLTSNDRFISSADFYEVLEVDLQE